MEYIQKLLQLSTSKKYKKGSVIISEGSGAPYCMYIILTGGVSVYKNHNEPEEVLLTTLKPGDFFGEMSLYLKQPRTATVFATKETIAVEIDEKNVESILHEYPDFTRHIINTLCLRISDLNERLI